MWRGVPYWPSPSRRSPGCTSCLPQPHPVNTRVLANTSQVRWMNSLQTEWMSLTSALALCTCCSPNTLKGEPWMVLRWCRATWAARRAGKCVGSRSPVLAMSSCVWESTNTHTWEHSDGLWAFITHCYATDHVITVRTKEGGGEEMLSWWSNAGNSYFLFCAQAPPS